MYIQRLHTILYLGLILLLAAIYLSLQHWPFGKETYIAALAVSCIFYALVLVEIFTSKRATLTTKLIWGIAYVAIALVPVLIIRGIPAAVIIYLAGSYYIRTGRRKFFQIKIKQRQFDSIDM